MKLLTFYCLVSCLCLFTGCGLQPDVNISGSTYEIPSGVVELTDDKGGEVISAARINNNSFVLKKPYLKRAGYYNLVLAEDRKWKTEYLVYLETGKYTVAFIKEGAYPSIHTNSETQHQISAFYAIKDSITRLNKRRLAELETTIRTKQATLTRDELNNSLNELSSENTKALSLNTDALGIFMKRYPDNHIAAKLMIKMPYDSDIKKYSALYKNFNAYNKETEEGKTMAESFELLSKLEPGETAPDLAGLTPDGRKIDLKSFKTKLILVEFWKAASRKSRENHQAMVSNPFGAFGENLSMVSVNLDTKRDWWLGASKADKIWWTNVSDLKGNNSPNVKNWAISLVPTYYLLDSQGRILFREISFFDIKQSVDIYLAGHTN